MKTSIALAFVLVAAISGCGAARRAPLATAPVRASSTAGPVALGVSWPAFRPDDYANPERHVEIIRGAGFELVTLVPTYTYAGWNRIEFDAAPSFVDLRLAIAAALEAGLTVVVKPHLDPPLYKPGFSPLTTENHSWRAHCPWRGYFDVDPLSDAYLNGILMPTLDAIAEALRAMDDAGREVPPVRLELGSELMNSTVYLPERWAELGRRMRRARRERSLEGQVILSHNFSHHVQIPEDFVDRMSFDGRRALSDYVRHLDALAISQYMDLTVAVPAPERSTRLPRASEVATALAMHEAHFRGVVLAERLGIPPEEIPPIHIGEFGIGLGGLSHPNLWSGELDAREREALGREVIRGHEGVLEYARRGARVRSVVLWVTGGTYDVFGWMDPSWRIPEVVASYTRFFEERALSGRAP